MVRMKNHNLNELSLLAGVDIEFINKKGNRFYFHVPTILESYTSNYDYDYFVGCMITPMDELCTKLNQPLMTRLEFIKQAIYRKKNDTAYTLSFKHFMNVVFKKEIRMVDDWLLDGNYVIDDQVMDFLSYILAVNTGTEKLEDVQKELASNVKKTPEELEWDRLMREQQKQINQVKNKFTDSKLTVDLMIAAVMREFKMSIEELMNKNFYFIRYFYRACLKIDAYSLNLIAEGNGNVDAKKHKHKYWVNM